MGGMFGESKYDVLKKVPSRYTAITTFIKTPCEKNDVINKMEHQGLKLPVIFKPDLGERGFMVQRINTESDIENYLSRMKYSFMIQELIDLPLEFGVFYLRYPSQQKGQGYFYRDERNAIGHRRWYFHARNTYTTQGQSKIAMGNLEKNLRQPVK